MYWTAQWAGQQDFSEQGRRGDAVQACGEDNCRQHAAKVLKYVGYVIEAHAVLTERVGDGEMVAKMVSDNGAKTRFASSRGRYAIITDNK